MNGHRTRLITMAQHSLQMATYTTYYNGTALLTRLTMTYRFTMVQHSLHDLLQWHSIPYTTCYNGTAFLTRLIDLRWHSMNGSEHDLLRLHSINGSEDAYLQLHSINGSEHAYLRWHRTSEHACLFTLTQHRWECGKHGTAWGVFS